MDKMFLFLSLVCIALADEMKQEAGPRVSRGITFGSSGTDGGYGASFYGKSDGLSYGSDQGIGAEGSYQVHNFGDSGISGHQLVGHNLGEYSFGGFGHGGLSLGGESFSGHHFNLGGAGAISSHNIVGGNYENNYEEGESKEHEGGYEDSHEGGYEGSSLSLNIHGDPHVHETTKAVPVHKTIKIPIHHPVHQAIKIPVPVKVPVPYAIKIPIPVQVEKTVNVPVEKVIHYPVEKPIPYKVVKKVPVPVSKPYPVPVPVYKVRYVYHTKKIHHGHHHHGYHY